jgi:hypothetical protein
VAWLVIAFTLAHSITLRARGAGVVRLDGAAVEALIGYSIALVAAENGWPSGRGPRCRRSRPRALRPRGAGGGWHRRSPSWRCRPAFLASPGLLARTRSRRLRAAVALPGLVHGWFAGAGRDAGLPRNAWRTRCSLQRRRRARLAGVVAWCGLPCGAQEPRALRVVMPSWRSAPLHQAPLYWFLERTLAP